MRVVPVVERARRILHLDVLEPRVLARRLVEVSVQAEEASGHGHCYMVIRTLSQWPQDDIRAELARR